MNKFSEKLIESLTEACAHAEGKPTGVRQHIVEMPDVRAIRCGLRMSQQGAGPTRARHAGAGVSPITRTKTKAR